MLAPSGPAPLGVLFWSEILSRRDAFRCDPVIGRWLAVDPKTNFTPGLTPYHYCRNNPLNRFDPDGMADFGTAAKLTAAGNKVVADPSLKMASDGTTYCNFGARNILQAGGDNSFNGMKANEIFDYLSNKEVATSISYESAADYANEGVTVILAAKSKKGSGHVAVVAPGDMVSSGKWGKKVPQIFNIGKKNEVRGANYGFESGNQPMAFILNNDKKSADSRIASRNTASSSTSSIKSMQYSALGIDPSKSPQAVWKSMQKTTEQDNTRVSQ